jgi:hypothetical protein
LYILGDQYLKAGMKKDALDNLQKAKAVMEKSKEQENSNYPLVLRKLASLELNNGSTDNCIRLARDALRNAQKIPTNREGETMKIFEVLCRAYEIKGEKEELRKLGAQCAKDFNQTQSRSIYAEMVKICLAGTIAKLSSDKSRALLTLADKIKSELGLKDESETLNELMQKAGSIVVMENFMMKSEVAEKYLAYFSAKKQDSAEAN